jgi:sec-independent protein translocase protein TatA
MGGGEIILIVLVALLLFGAKGLPDIARMVGKTLREVKKATDDIKREINQETGILNDVNQIRSEIQSVGRNVVNQITKEGPTQNVADISEKVKNTVDDVIQDVANKAGTNDLPPIIPQEVISNKKG